MFSCPGDLNLMNPAIVTIKTRYPTVKIIFTLDTVQMMRKYQMTPDLLRRLMHPAAGEEIDPDIETFSRQNKFDPNGEPGILNPQRKMKDLSRSSAFIRGRLDKAAHIAV